MNRIIEEFRRDDERILDRLVDGELTEEDRKALLSALDEEPGSWRRCALAFLEAQSWRGDFQGLRNERVLAIEPALKSSDTSAPEGSVSLPPAKSSHFFEICLAVAACVVLAFGIGVWVRSAWYPPSSLNGNMRFVKDSRAPDKFAPQPVNRWQRVTLDDPSTVDNENIRLPVREVESLTEDHLRQSRSALPEEVRRALERSGYRVNQRQQLVPFELKDGRRLLVPVEEVDVEPDGGPAY
jgi:hypothetical protein